MLIVLLLIMVTLVVITCVRPHRENLGSFAAGRVALRTAADRSLSQDVTASAGASTQSTHVLIVPADVPTTRRRPLRKPTSQPRRARAQSWPVVRISSIRVRDEESQPAA